VISVLIGAPDPAMSGPFDALARGAAPNVFMHPAALCAAAGFAKIHVLQAWNDKGELVGFWALGERRILPFGPAVLAAPPTDYAFVGSPVVDPDHVDAVMPAFFDCLANAPKLPKVIKLKLLDGDSASRALMTALSQHGGQMRKLSEHARPFLSGEADRKRSGSTAKKLRQDWNRLSALGAVDVVNERSADDVVVAFEIFLEMELRSWKGQNGTALQSDDDDADFARRLIGNLAGRHHASVALLRVDGRPIAAQVLLYCGTMAYTWKTAFDAAFAKFSPGALLIDKAADALFASGITQFESCAAEESFMAQLWTGRRATVDLLLDVGAESSVSFALAHLGERAYAFARDWRQRLRGSAWLPARRKNLATTRG